MDSHTGVWEIVDASSSYPTPVKNLIFLKRQLLSRQGWGLFETNVRVQWNSVYKAFHQIRCCGNETNC